MFRHISLSTVCFGVVSAYVSYTIWTMAQLFVPPKCPVPENCLESFLSDKPSLDLYLFSSVNQELKVHDSVKLVEYMKNFSYLESWERKIVLDVPKAVRDNGTFYLHLFAVPSSSNYYEQWFKIIQNDKAAYCRVKLTQLHVPDSYVFNLLKEEKLSEEEYEKKKKEIKSTVKAVSHLKSKVTINMLTEPQLLSKNVPNELYYYIRVTQNKKFLPIITYNFLETRLEDLKLMKNATEEILLKYSPTYYGKLMVMVHVESTVLTLKKMGFSARDIDDIKSFFAGTNFYLLCITIVVSSFHLLFDFLAFKNDVNFWNNKSTLEGLSFRTILWRAFSQTVVLLYLFDEKASLIVLGPSAIATSIEMWKVGKVMRRLRSKDSSASEKLTNEYDAECMKYLSYLLYPLCVAGAIYSLFYLPHKSWYSWCIHSLVNCVYAFGFLFMLPQLFVNYRLKSVEALPWKAFMYKGFNTFIDDLFAFIITMPTAHRVACFRDDVIFLIYLYQRWLYPVDKNRVSESTPFLNDEIKEKEERKKKK